MAERANDGVAVCPLQSMEAASGEQCDAIDKPQVKKILSLSHGNEMLVGENEVVFTVPKRAIRDMQTGRELRGVCDSLVRVSYVLNVSCIPFYRIAWSYREGQFVLLPWRADDSRICSRHIWSRFTLFWSHHGRNVLLGS